MTRSSVSPSCLYSSLTLCRSSIICVRHSLLMKPLETPMVNGPWLPSPPPLPLWLPPPQAAANTTATEHTTSPRTLPIVFLPHILSSPSCVPPMISNDARCPSTSLSSSLAATPFALLSPRPVPLVGDRIC